MRFVPLPKSFYEPSAEVVAPQLLGHWLVRRVGRDWCGGPIVETEAYLMDDPASHGFRGETARNRAMYGPPGRAYVYLIYGCHYCVNAVCHPAGRAEAVLIRALEPQFNEAAMRLNRPGPHAAGLTNGPAKLCAALNIGRALDGADLGAADSDLRIAANPQRAEFCAARGPIVTTTRVGLTKAADRPLRYYLDRSLYVSRRVRAVARPSI
ncbi:MAG TPA: DNA-3-methyladenine glycosylase [Verrucomicrobiae bacterium]|jgi:DNA-3-methyladenine glycosylase|nr:DNA-3-methyladenine glycosylase [Verrucomicrobiae bacterium]